MPVPPWTGWAPPAFPQSRGRGGAQVELPATRCAANGSTSTRTTWARSASSLRGVTAQLFAYVSYRDARAALDWLAALGFSEVRRQEGSDGVVTHAEVRWGDVVLMVSGDTADHQAPPLVGETTGRGLYLRVEDVDGDRKSTRLNSSHANISYAVFCLKKK